VDNSTHVLIENPPAYLQDDWLTDQEHEDKYHQDQREQSIRTAQLRHDQPRRDPPHIASPPDIIPNEHVTDAPEAFYDKFLYQPILFLNAVLRASMPVNGRPHNITMCS
jgi:hypothetical protein